ncbi:MAG: FlgO family outer membrane protein [Candidatus Electronema sp. VV]
MNKRTLSICGAAMFLSLLVSSAFGYEKEIEQLSSQMAEKIAGKGKKTVAVVDFTDLEGNVTQLDQFIAEEFSVALAGAGKGFRVIDRTRLMSIIKENKLAATGLIDPATASKLGKIAGVDALVTGTLTPFGDTVHLTVKVLDSNTADVIDSAKSDIAKTPAINELLGKEMPSESTKGGIESKLQNQKLKHIAGKIEKAGVTFELIECRANTTMVTCSLLITNNGEDRPLSIHNMRMFDIDGNEYHSSEIRLNNQIYINGVNLRFIQGAKLKPVVGFDKVSIAENSIPIIELSVSIPTGNFFILPFKGISLSRIK